VPAVGSREPLLIEFDRPLDHALLQRGLSIVTATGGNVAGRFAAGAGETAAEFRPQQPWQRGEHALEVDARLEDIAGNSPTRVFDRDLTRLEDDPVPPPLPLRFTPLPM
jgi:hypothetical protein